MYFGHQDQVTALCCLRVNVTTRELLRGAFSKVAVTAGVTEVIAKEKVTSDLIPRVWTLLKLPNQ
jgi:hypothetical protein